jgi:hypothetical protein
VLIVSSHPCFLPQLYCGFAVVFQRPPRLATTKLVAKARLRLNAMQQLCARHGVQFVLLIPPSLARNNDLLASAAELQHIAFQYPLPKGSLGPEFFRADRNHLNEKGAAVFTGAIERHLRARLASPLE